MEDIFTFFGIWVMWNKGLKGRWWLPLHSHCKKCNIPCDTSRCMGFLPKRSDSSETISIEDGCRIVMLWRYGRLITYRACHTYEMLLHCCRIPSDEAGHLLGRLLTSSFPAVSMLTCVHMFHEKEKSSTFSASSHVAPQITSTKGTSEGLWFS